MCNPDPCRSFLVHSGEGVNHLVFIFAPGDAVEGFDEIHQVVVFICCEIAVRHIIEVD